MTDKAAKLQPLFDLMDKAGGPKLTNAKSLDFGQKMKVSSNIWAFLFTIFYYIYHGMWKKGLILLLISIGVTVLVDTFIPSLSNITWVITSAIFATRANIDLYKKYKLGDDGWV